MSGEARQVPAAGTAAGDDLVQRVGQLTRMLRESMRELGLDKEVEKAAEAIPDARERLNYVASMTEKAAERALNAIDRAQPLQNDIEQRAQALGEQWRAWSAAPAQLSPVDELVRQTGDFLDSVPGAAQATNRELMEIMMAQDFQDLTGQVIKRMMDVIREVERQLLQVLVDNAPEGRDREEMRRILDQPDNPDSTNSDAILLNGPQVNPEGDDVVSDQDQVDALLDELGF